MRDRENRLVSIALATNTVAMIVSRFFRGVFSSAMMLYLRITALSLSCYGPSGWQTALYTALFLGGFCILVLLDSLSAFRSHRLG
ncbi:hypothetical protein ASPWEDRAFT_624478 [Aspergillus wentii DTO 134E9]|uniref:Uncharacterized protein n=1 Tax=Aspergillus wentii DTO 134E9 TaxID=1073089 RepID=A0A1L9RF63_ASPWE|nr:uncharacterized protein ASPWEDRAFT_624478 [Aspergillus wentii DTO 134E9]OJJ33571.1 hypothetical protein ASPWEDRAFT_624478 [Aspergillus wentii DTO 134E9]